VTVCHIFHTLASIKEKNMSYRIKKVAVLGSGVMGSGIACHLANVGMEVVMLDILPVDLEAGETNPALRNQVANQALAKAIKSKPAALFDKKFAQRITTGNFEDDFDKIADADWIVEVVVERLDIKQAVFEKVEAHRKSGSLVSSNTSSIPIHLLAEGRSAEFKKHFCGTHFFNPPRYLRLLEIIPIPESDPKMIEFFMEFGDVYLGKQTVLCKDTPAFIANRIGVMSGVRMMSLTQEYGMSVEEVDAITGPLIGRPKTATFKLQDLVGIDTGEKVTNFVRDNVQDDPFFESIKGDADPKFMTYLIENKFFGNKSGKGFYERTKKRDEKGRSIINVLNLETLEYAPTTRPKLPLVKEAKAIEQMGKRFQFLISGEGRECQFLRNYFASLLSYTADRIPEIADEIFLVDDAMRAGYVWDFGPFEYWDLIGVTAGIELIESCGWITPDWVKEMQSKGIEQFYKFENGIKKCYSLSAKAYEPVKSTEGLIILDSYRENTPILKNSECTVHDIGDGVMCLEFTSKSNAIGEGIGKAMVEAIEIAERNNWNGIVIGNNAKQFSVGANLMNVGMMAMQKKFDDLNQMVKDFQDINMRVRTSKIPVVVATQGYVFGGGCEISMHCDAGIYAAESYIGLVEVGVGLLPGGGGTKEFSLRASDAFFEGDVKIPTLVSHFKNIATAAVGTSATEAFNLHYLQEGRDFVCYNTQRNIGEAKAKVLELAPNYVPPSVRTDIEVLGRTGISALYTAINEFKLGGYMSDYDVEIAREIARVICGGDLTSPQKVDEQYLLDIEREGFLTLLGNQKTQDRIQHILMYNRPLRN
jgi:3-hydroxyacyl-CoA dehydrogenase